MRLVIWLGVVAATTYIVLGGGYGTLDSSTARLLDDLLAGAVLLIWLGAAVLRPDLHLVPATRLGPAILACLAAFALSTALSWNQRLSLEMLGYALVLALLYLLLVRLMADPYFRARLAILAVLLAVVVGIAYLGSVGLLWREWWLLVGHVALPPLRPAYDALAYGSPNIVATVMLVLGAMGGAAAIGVATHRRLAALVTLGALVALAVLISGSRGAWLGAAVGVIVVAAAWLVHPDHRRLARAAARRVPLGVRLLAGGAALVLIGAGLVFARSRLTLDDSGLRATYTAVSARMFQAAPLTGLGPGTWPVARATFTMPTEIDFWNPHAQSIYAQTVGEFGLVGILAGLVAAACLLRLLLDGLRSADPARRRVGYAATFVVALLAAQQLVDFFANLPALLVASALPIAWLDATSPRPERPSPFPVPAGPAWPRVPRRALALAAAVAVVATTGGLWHIESVAATSDRGVALANAGDWAGSIAPLREAASDGDLAIYQFDLGVAAANVGDRATARTALRRAAEGDDQALAWVDLAEEDFEAGDLAAARTDLTGGERLGWQDVHTMVAAAAVRARLGDADAALRDGADAVADSPSLALDAAGWATVLPGVALRAIVDAALARLQGRRGNREDPGIDTGRALVAIFAGRPAVLADATSRLADEGGAPAVVDTLRLAGPAWAGDAAATAALLATADRLPQLNTAVTFAALLAQRASDQAAADRYRQQALITEPFSAVGQAWVQTIEPWTVTPPDRLTAPTGQYESAYRRSGLTGAVVRPLPVLRQH